MRRHWLLSSALISLLGSLYACNTRTVLKPNPQPKTSYEMLVPQTALRYSLAPGETAVQPQPDKQAAPVYPQSLLHPGAAPVTVVAQLVMDGDGHVQGVYRFPIPPRVRIVHCSRRPSNTPRCSGRSRRCGCRSRTATAVRADGKTFQPLVRVPLQGRGRQADHDLE